MTTTFNSTIGIIGGSGPAASAYALQRFVERSQVDFGASDDSDFPTLLCSVQPISEIDARGFKHDDTTSIKQQLQKTAQNLGSDLVFAPCNTVHSQLRDILDPDEFVDMVALTESYLITHHPGASVAVLCSETTEASTELYAHPGINYLGLSSSQRETVNNAISTAMSTPRASRVELKKMIDSMEADVVVLGCTELSLLIDQQTIEADGLIDAQEIAITNCLERARS